MEIWKDIEGYDGRYEISNHGNVRNKGYVVEDSWGRKRKIAKRVMKNSLDANGYFRVNLPIGGKAKVIHIHVLVCRHFVSRVYGKNSVNHIDGNKLNNHFSNLEWCTQRENIQHAFRTGLVNNTGENHGYSKLTNEQVLEIRSLEGQFIQKDIGKMFGISREQVGTILRRQQWKHI
jgi:hypothetical protein